MPRGGKWERIVFAEGTAKARIMEIAKLLINLAKNKGKLFADPISIWLLVTSRRDGGHKL